MKFSYVAILVAALAFWACDDDDSSSTKPSSETPSSSSNKDSSTASYDCSVEDGVVVAYPKGGEKFKLGETVKVVYGASENLAGPQFIFRYRASENDAGTDLTDEAVGEKSPDGKTCYEQEVVLDAELATSEEGFIQVIPYVETRKNGKSGKFTVTE